MWDPNERTRAYTILVLRFRFVLLFSLLGFSLAPAQQVVEENENPNPFLRSIRRASESGPGWFPELSAANPDGSAVIASGDFHNSDVTIIFEKSRLDEFIPKAQSLALKIGRPETILRIKRGRVIGAIDMEFNRYLTTSGNTASSTIPLGQIVSEVETWGLPQPLGVGIDAEGADANVSGRQMQGMILLDPKEVLPNWVLHVSKTRHWYGLVFALLLGSLFLGLFGVVLYLPFKKMSIPMPRSAPATFAEAQKLYDKPVKGRIPWLALMPMPFMLFVLIGGRSAMSDIVAWIPSGFSPRSIVFLPLILILPAIALVIKQRRRPTPADPFAPIFSRLMPILFIPLMLLMALLLFRLDYPRSLPFLQTPITTTVVRVIAFSPIPLMFIFGYFYSRKNTVVLAAGDPDFDSAMEFARKSGSQVRRVVVKKLGKIVNAYAAFNGIVGVTQAARERLTVQERRCLLAHEIGHIKGKHVPWIMLFGFATLGLYFLLVSLITSNSQMGARAYVAVAPFMPIVLILGMQFLRAPFQKKSEYAADKFALEQIGNFDEVAGALAKVHLMNASPYQMKRFHESFAAHPSLLKRLKTLEETARQMGMPVQPGSAQRIIDEAVIEDASETETMPPPVITSG